MKRNMIRRSTLSKAWELLDAQERRNALKVLAVAVLSAFASTAMVGSVLPFLSVLSDPAYIHNSPMLSGAYTRLGFVSSHGFLLALGIVVLGVIALALAIQLLKAYAVARYSMMRVHSLSYRLMTRYLGQPYEYFLDHHSGDMGTRVLAEAQEVVSRFLRPMLEAVTASLTVVALVAFLIWIEPLVAFVSFTVLGGIYASTFALAKMKMRRLGQARVIANAARYRLATEALGGIKDIKLLGRERAYVDRFVLPSHRMALISTHIQLISEIPTLAIQGVAFGGIVVLCLVVMDSEAFEAGTALGTLLPILGVFAFAGQRLMPELARLYQSITVIQAGKAAVDAVHADLVGSPPQLPREMPDALGLKSSLQLDGVTYRYPKAERAGISDISVTIRAGEKIGIVGSTGSGKTTLADIILGLLQPRSGKILVDGVPLSAERLRAWQQTVGYVPQDIFLTDSSVAENIALGIAPGQIDMDRVIRAARIARIDEFIRTELHQGYETPVGERGVRLSGGQRQRIGIARALYHDADLIVFDEATSALDNMTEADVMVAIDALPGDKTVLMIAHRLSTVKRCDRVIVLEQGHIVGCDTWERLMADNAAFQKIARIGDAA